MSREFDIFSENAVFKIYEYAQKMMPMIVADHTNKMANAAYRLWTSAAEGAGSWGGRYASTIVIEPASAGGTAKVYVDESHDNVMYVYMMEEGVKSWSIKDALLAGKAAQRNQAKYGVRFVHVPFRHRTPSKIKATSIFSSVMPEDVYKQAKDGGTVGPEAGKYAGLKRFARGPHVGYFTFRTVTEKSEGWEHPGKAPTPVFEKVKAQVEKMIEGAITEWVKEFSDKAKKEFGEK